MRIPTMISLDYEAERWSYLRIVIDGISNHIDAVGSRDRVRITVSPTRIEIADDGKGYDYNLLGLLYSTKSSDLATIGQFGEGIKLIATASLRLGCDFRLRSRDWEATALAEPVTVETAPGCRTEVNRLVWDVRTGLIHIIGSRTIIEHPSGLPDGLVEAFMGWTRLFLPDERRLREHAWEDATPRLFVKGVYVRNLDGYMFSYNLVDCQINRDRDTVDALSNIRGFWERCDDPDAIAMFLRFAGRAMNQAVSGNPMPVEFVMWFYPKARHVWTNTFKSIFGEKAVLSTKRPESYIAEGMGFNPVILPNDVVYALVHCGVQKDADVVSNRDVFRFRDLTPDENAVVQKAFSLIRAASPEVRTYPVFAIQPVQDSIRGVALHDEKVIGIHRDALGDAQTLLPVLIEEVAHLESGATDFTREFEAWLVNFAAMALDRHSHEGQS